MDFIFGVICGATVVIVFWLIEKVLWHIVDQVFAREKRN